MINAEEARIDITGIYILHSLKTSQILELMRRQSFFEWSREPLDLDLTDVVDRILRDHLDLEEVLS